MPSKDFSLWPWWGSRPGYPGPFVMSRLMWDAPRGRWWTGIPKELEKERER